MMGRGNGDTHDSPSPVVISQPPAINAAADDQSAVNEDVSDFFTEAGARASLPVAESKDLYSDLVRGILKVESMARGRIKCFFSVIPAVLNPYNGLHGGAVAMVVERAAIACARTVVAEDKALFLAELSLSYLSAATLDDELVVEGSLAKIGRNMSVVSTEIGSRHTWKLMYLSHATFFHGLPNSKL